MAHKDEEKAEKWRRVLQEYDGSGESAAAFCRERQLSTHVFYYWRRRLGEGADAAEKAGRFVRVGGEREAGSGVAIRVGEWRIELASDFSEPTLLRTLKALGRC